MIELSSVLRRGRKQIENGRQSNPGADHGANNSSDRFDKVTTANVWFVCHRYLLLFQLPFKGAGGCIHVDDCEGEFGDAVENGFTVYSHGKK